MTWNHRLIDLCPDKKCPFYAVHEVFYDKKGKPHSWTEKPIDVSGESIDEINKLLIQILVDINSRPPLKVKFVDKEEKLVEVKKKRNSIKSL